MLLPSPSPPNHRRQHRRVPRSPRRSIEFGAGRVLGRLRGLLRYRTGCCSRDVISRRNRNDARNGNETHGCRASNRQSWTSQVQRASVQRVDIIVSRHQSDVRPRGEPGEPRSGCSTKAGESLQHRVRLEPQHVTLGSSKRRYLSSSSLTVTWTFHRITGLSQAGAPSDPNIPRMP